MGSVVSIVVRVKNFSLELHPGHRHPVHGRGTPPVVKIGVEIVPDIDPGFTELIL
jgi:hypothetical protein